MGGMLVVDTRIGCRELAARDGSSFVRAARSADRGADASTEEKGRSARRLGVGHLQLRRSPVRAGVGAAPYRSGVRRARSLSETRRRAGVIG